MSVTLSRWTFGRRASTRVAPELVQSDAKVRAPDEEPSRRSAAGGVEANSATLGGEGMNETQVIWRSFGEGKAGPSKASEARMGIYITSVVSL